MLVAVSSFELFKQINVTTLDTALWQWNFEEVNL